MKYMKKTDIKGSSKQPSYIKWSSMFTRCYSNKLHESNKSYIGCYVCNAWELYSNFKKWYDINYIEGTELDKDILGDGKLYSPETCCFVPNYLNTVFTNHNRGTDYRHNEMKYRARLKKYGNKIELGYYTTEEEAHSVYIKEKHKYIRELAIKAYMENKISEYIMNKIIEKAYKLD